MYYGYLAESKALVPRPIHITDSFRIAQVPLEGCWKKLAVMVPPKSRAEWPFFLVLRSLVEPKKFEIHLQVTYHLKAGLWELILMQDSDKNRHLP